MELVLNPTLPTQREQLRRLFRVKRSEGEMMLKRGFLLSEVFLLQDPQNFDAPEAWRVTDLTFIQDTVLTLDELLAERQRLGIFSSRQNFSSVYISADRSRMVLVLYLLNEPGKEVKKGGYQIVHQFIQSARYHHIILVTETGLTADNNKSVRERSPGYNIEVFLDAEFQMNILKHALPPILVRHVPSAEVATWAQTEQIQHEKLPMLLNIDPVSKRFGAKPLDVFQEVVMGTTTDTAGFYRICRQSSVRQ